MMFFDQQRTIGGLSYGYFIVATIIVKLLLLAKKLTLDSYISNIKKSIL